MRQHARPGSASGGEGEAAWPDRVTVLERQAEAERIAAETEEARRPRVKAKRSQSALKTDKRLSELFQRARRISRPPRGIGHCRTAWRLPEPRQGYYMVFPVKQVTM